MKHLPILATFVLLAATTAVFQSPQSVYACSIAGLTSESLPSLVENTSIIAVGTWTTTSELEATLAVSEGLKGAQAGDEIEVDNRQARLGVDCSTYGESLKDGFRFTEGQRSVVFLEKEVNGLWQVGYFSFAAFEVDDDDSAPLLTPGGQNPSGIFSLSDVRTATFDERLPAAVETATVVVPVVPFGDLDTPEEGGLGPSEQIGLMAATAVIAAIGYVVWKFSQRKPRS
jgi:hypothetical protein